MASKENAERKELHRKIWAIADDVRGAVDGWDFKQYILGILFLSLLFQSIWQTTLITLSMKLEI